MFDRRRTKACDSFSMMIRAAPRGTSAADQADESRTVKWLRASVPIPNPRRLEGVHGDAVRHGERVRVEWVGCAHAERGSLLLRPAATTPSSHLNPRQRRPRVEPSASDSPPTAPNLPTTPF